MAIKLLYLGNRLSAKGRNVSTIDTLARSLSSLNYEVYTYSDQPNQFRRLLSMLAAVIRHRNVNYLLIDTYSTLGFWFAYLSAMLAKFLGLPYIPILHGGDLPKRLDKNPRICHQLFAGAYKNIAPSPYLIHHFKKAGFQNLSYIPNSIEIDHYPYKKRKSIAPKLLWVRAFAHIYNPIMALYVLETLMKDYPQAELSMVGPFKDDSIQQCQQLAQEKNLPVKFTGGMPKADWLDYAKDFDVFINTTKVDNTPVSVIEAMALGLPVVSTNVGGIPFLVSDEEEALLVPSDNVLAMSDAIKRLLKNPDIVASLTSNGRKKAESFDWEAVKKSWVRILNYGSRLWRDRL